MLSVAPVAVVAPLAPPVIAVGPATLKVLPKSVGVPMFT